MGDKNIRDFRGAYQGQEDEKSGSSKGFGLALIAIPVAAAVAGFAYQPLMEMRQGNVQALAVAEAGWSEADAATINEGDIFNHFIGQAQATDQARDVLDSLPRNPETGLINLNQPMRRSPESEARKKAQKKVLPIRDYMLVRDTKGLDFTKGEIQELKYRRAKTSLNICGYTQLRNLYVTKNQKKYDALIQARKDEITGGLALNGSLQNDELRQVKTKGDALKFVMGGGVERHNQRINKTLSGLGTAMGSGEKRQVKRYFISPDEKQCMQIRTLAQGGQLNI